LKRPRPALLRDAAALAACLLFAGSASVWLGQDANWDLRNYHYYNAYAFLNGRLAWDVAPAQLQTYHNPFPDLFFYAIADRLPARVVAFVMAAPAGLAAFFLWRSADILFRELGRAQRAILAGTALLVGMTGAAGFSVIGSTMNEWPLAALVSAAIFLVLRAFGAAERPSATALAMAGLLAGIAAGCKLTYGVFALGLAAGIALSRADRSSLKSALVCAIGVAAGFLLAYGPWALVLWREFGNPVFPYLNGVFKSPFWDAINFTDFRYGPRTALQWLAFPLYFSHISTLASEQGFRDYRLALLCILAVVTALAAVVRQGAPGRHFTPAWRFLCVFALVSYLAWEALFSIYRYLVPLELASGLLIAFCVLRLVPDLRGAVALVLLLSLLLAGTTRRMGWERVPFQERYFEVAAPALSPAALVILTSTEPMAYAIPFLAADARFVAPANGFLRPGQDDGLARRAAAAISHHAGPLYSMSHRKESEAAADTLLAGFGLDRDPGSCAPIRSNLDGDAIRLCRLSRR
jgi:hypothetical protein